MELLQNIPIGEEFRVVAVTGDGATAQRVRELGLIPGAVVRVVRRAPFGGPMEVALERRHFGLRLDKGMSIQVEPLTAVAEPVADVMKIKTPAERTTETLAA